MKKDEVNWVKNSRFLEQKRSNIYFQIKY